MDGIARISPQKINGCRGGYDPRYDLPDGAKQKAALYSGRMCVKCFVELPTGAPRDETLCDDCK